MVSATWWYAESLVMSGTSALFWRRSRATRRITGTDRNMTTNAAASPTVMGKPRSTRHDARLLLRRLRIPGGRLCRHRDPDGERDDQRQAQPHDPHDPGRDGVGDRHERQQERGDLGRRDSHQKNRPGDRRGHHDGEERLLARGGLPEQGADRPPEEGVQDLAGGFGDERQKRLQQSHAEKVGPVFAIDRATSDLRIRFPSPPAFLSRYG